MSNSSSIIIIKPDVLKQGLEIELRKRIAEQGLEINELGSIMIDLEFVKQIYQWTILRYPVEIENYLCKRPLSVWLIRGKDAIIKMLAIKKDLRNRYSVDRLHTLIHCPDSSENFEREHSLILDRISSKKGENMKTNNQVEVVVFKRNEAGSFVFLILKINPKKGGFWQPITGNVEQEETFEEATNRELREETGITSIIRLVDTGYSFKFFDDNRQQLEKVFGAEVDSDTEVILSEEHVEFQWVSGKDALNKYLKYPGNKEGLKKLIETIER